MFMSNKMRLWVSLVICLIVVGIPAVYAAPEVPDPGHSQIYDIFTVFPKEVIQKAEAEGYPVKFSRYEPSRYSLELYLADTYFWDVDDKVANTAHYFLHGINNNIIWQGLLTWDFLIIMVVENAFSLDIVNQFADAVQKAVQQLAGFGGSGYTNSGIIGNFVTFMFILAGAWIAYKGLIQKKTSDALSGMMTSLVIFILGMAFFANASGVLRYVNDISSGLSQEVMGVGITFQQKLGSSEDYSKYPGDVSSLIVADKLYNMFVYEPYLMLQYGKTSIDPRLTEERVNSLLSHKVGSTARKEIVKHEIAGDPEKGYAKNTMMTTQGTFERLTLLILLCVSHLILGLLFLIIAGAMLVYQFMFVLIALFAPFAFLLAIHPAWSSVASTWFRSFIGYQLVKLIIGVFFSMLLTLSQFLYDMNPPGKVGYIWTITMQLILVAGTVWKRNELFNMLKAPMGKTKGFQTDLNIQVPINYLTKYTDKLATRVQQIRLRNK